MRLRTLGSLGALLLLLGALEARQQEETAGDYVAEKDVMVPMRDGVRLATDLYFPARGGRRLEGRYPAIMERTPYNKSGALKSWVPFFVSRGYVCIAQDTRGRYASEGIWHMMTDDVQDGYDTAAWIVRQPWSDGGFGTLGTSYPGGTQHALATSDPPGLKAMVPVDAVANAGYFGMRNGGAFELRFMNWIFTTGAPVGSRAARDPALGAALQEMGKNVRQRRSRSARERRPFDSRRSTRIGSCTRCRTAPTTSTGNSRDSASSTR